MDASDEQFGSMSIVSKIALLAQWAPMLAKLEAVANAKTPADRGLAIVAALRLAADKTLTAKDNNALDLVEAILRTPEGAALANWFALVAGEVK